MRPTLTDKTLPPSLATGGKTTDLAKGSTNAVNLHRNGLKATGPRLRILALFQAQKKACHLTADDIYHQLSHDGVGVGLATVYRALLQLEQSGILERHIFEGEKAVFELKDENHHDHLVCLQCGRVEEFYDNSIEERQRKVAQELGFDLREHSLALYGDCINKNCAHRKSTR